MDGMQGQCLCGKNRITIPHYGAFVYTCHCDMCRKMSAGPVFAIDPETSKNVVFDTDSQFFTLYQSSEEVERGFCTTCGTYLFWHHQVRDHYCLNAELFDGMIPQAEFGLQVFYDKKPAYYDFVNQTRKLTSEWKDA